MTRRARNEGKPLGSSERYLAAVEQLRLGKRTQQAVYAHRVLVGSLPLVLRECVRKAIAVAGIAPDGFDVVKLHSESFRVSLLSYPGFFDEPFPVLRAAWTVEPERRKCVTRTYQPSGNPPILHRKELLLPTGHEAVAPARAITRELEQRGLFRDARSIGFRANWEKRLRAAGIEVLRPSVSEAPAALRQLPNSFVVVDRHRTAVSRTNLSLPMQALRRAGFLDGRFSVFDYGCGRGDDLNALADLGIVARGWDPHFLGHAPIARADIVNLGFVINVIEDPAERRSTLRAAFDLSDRLLVVAALLQDRLDPNGATSFSDGVLTRRRTFQKYYTQSELRDYLADATGRTPIAVDRGVFFVFVKDDDEQTFLAKRVQSRRASVGLARVLQELPEAQKSIVERFWTTCLDLGRLPTSAEFVELDAMQRQIGTAKSLLRRLLEQHGASAFEDARRARRDDLRVYLALNLFERRRSLARLPDPLRPSVRALFGSFGQAEEEARALLYSIADTERLNLASRDALRPQLGRLSDEPALYVRPSVVERLPALIRVYVGCAARLYGDIELADLIKVHIGSGKVTLLKYRDFELDPVPKLMERVKISLRNQQIDCFTYAGDMSDQRLYLKSQCLPYDDPTLAAQQRFDEAIMATGLFDFSGFGPDGLEFRRILTDAGYVINGFSLDRTG